MKSKRNSSIRPELRSVSDVATELYHIFRGRSIEGVQGFVIVLQTKHSTIKVSWGDLKVRRKRRKKSE